MKYIAEFCRSMVRPIVTLEVVTALILFTYQGKIEPQVFAAVTAAIVGWWFYDRSKNGKS